MKINKLFSFFLIFISYCTQAQNFLLNENFNTATGTTPPSGWTNVTSVGDPTLDKWKFNNPQGYQYALPIKDTAAFVDSYNSGNAGGVNNGLPETVILQSPSFSTIGITGVFVQYDYFLLWLANVSANVDASYDGGTSWNTIATYSSITATVTTATLSLSSAYDNKASCMIRFRWTQPASANNNGYWLLDNVKVFSRYTTDATIGAVTIPVDYTCATTSQPVSVQVTNAGTGTITNVPVTVKVTGPITTTLTGSVSSLNALTSTTISVGTINTSAGGTYNFQVYTDLSGDQTKLNDTLYLTKTIATTPTDPGDTSSSRCGVGPVTFNVNGTSADTTYWYTTSSGGTPVGVGRPYVTSTLYTSTNYYVENARFVNNSISSTFTGPYRFNAVTDVGNMINVTTANDIILDSFDVNICYAGNYTVEVYWKNGSYVGSETTVSAWTSLGTASVTATGLGKPIRVKVNSVMLPAGGTYGLYFRVTGSSATFAFKALNGTYSNSDLTITGGSISSASFTNVTAGYTWDGNIYFRKKCSSPRKTAVATIYGLPSGSNFYPSTPYNGVYSSGTQVNPDIVYSGGTVKYAINAPSGYSNATHGTTWEFVNMSFMTVNGTPPNSGDTSTTMPGSNDATFTFTPPYSVEDTTYVLQYSIRNLSTLCDSIVTRYIYVAPKPHPGFLSGTSCSGKLTSFTDTSVILKGSLTYNWYFGDPNNSISTSKNPKFAYSAAGTYTIKLVVTSDLGHRDSIQKNITVANTPVVKFSNTNGCLGDTTRFTNLTTVGGGYTITGYVWDFGNSTSDIQTNPKTVYLSTGIYNVRLIATTNAGCSDTLDKPVSVFAKPVASFTPPANLCAATPASFSNTSTLSNGQMGVNWSFGDGETDFNISPTHQYLNAGNYSVKLKVYSNFGCFDSVTKTVVVAQTPKAAFTYANACTRDSVSFTNTTTFGGTGTVSLTWTFGDATTASTTGSVKHKYVNAGTYNASLKAEAGACFSTQSTGINVNTRPVAAFTTSSTCVNTPVQFSNTSVAGNSATSSWAFGDGGVAAGQSPTHSYTTVGNVNAKLVVMENNCYDSVSVPLTIHALPVVSFTSTPMAGIRQLQFNPNNPAMINYEWNMGDGNIVNQINPVYSFMSNGPFNVTLTASDSNGCSNSKTNQVSFNVSIGKMPDGLSSFEVYPNPFSNQTNISYTVAKTAKVEVRVYDMLGKEINTLVNEIQSSGSYHTLFSLNSVELKSGSYIVKIAIDGNIASKQIIAINR